MHFFAHTFAALNLAALTLAAAHSPASPALAERTSPDLSLTGTDAVPPFSLPTLITKDKFKADSQSIEAIRATLALYPLAIDGKNFDALSRIFTKDAVANYSAPLNVLTSLSTIQSTLKSNLNPVTTQHSYGTQLIDIISPDSAFSVTYYTATHFGRGLLFTGQTATAFGQYQDVLKKQRDGTWKITHRNLVYMQPISNPIKENQIHLSATTMQINAISLGIAALFASASAAPPAAFPRSGGCMDITHTETKNSDAHHVWLALKSTLEVFETATLNGSAVKLPLAAYHTETKIWVEGPSTPDFRLTHLTFKSTNTQTRPSATMHLHVMFLGIVATTMASAFAAPPTPQGCIPVTGGSFGDDARLDVNAAMATAVITANWQTPHATTKSHGKYARDYFRSSDVLKFQAHGPPDMHFQGFKLSCSPGAPQNSAGIK
ncbi:hypothetical protein V490_06615 [Pseudogymnoascus sp. VKM F-3557]|nr:hypothetical protein V490_06615 [Pseudogymnoascus sp. VKM F-3557]